MVLALWAEHSVYVWGIDDPYNDVSMSLLSRGIEPCDRLWIPSGICGIGLVFCYPNLILTEEFGLDSASVVSCLVLFISAWPLLDLDLNLELWPSIGADVPTSQALRGKLACTFLEETLSMSSPISTSLLSRRHLNLFSL